MVTVAPIRSFVQPELDDLFGARCNRLTVDDAEQAHRFALDPGLLAHFLDRHLGRGVADVRPAEVVDQDEVLGCRRELQPEFPVLAQFGDGVGQRVELVRFLEGELGGRRRLRRRGGSGGLLLRRGPGGFRRAGAGRRRWKTK